MKWLDNFIVSERGQWEHPGKLTAVRTDNGIITMEGVPYPVMGFVPGHPPIIMQPGGKYQFPGKMVYEIPMAYGGDISIPDLSRPNWLDKAQKGQQVRQKIYTDPLKFAKAKEIHDDSLSDYLKNKNIYESYSGAVYKQTYDEIAELAEKNKRDYGWAKSNYPQKPQVEPVYKEKPKEYIPIKTPKLERKPLQLIIPQSDRTLMPYNNALDVLRAVQEEDKSDKNLYPARVVPAPDFRHGGWLDEYQGDEGSSQVERRDPNQPFFPSSTEAGTYESQYSLPEVSVAPNWTEAELERNKLRDKYIKDDKKVWRHWYDKLGYDKDNVTKRANQFAYNKLAKQYLKADKDQLTEEQRKFIEKSEYANRLQPSIGSRFVEGVTNPGFNLETLGNLSAPFEYPTNLLRGAIKGEFTDALMGQTPSPYFVSSDLAGTSPTEAAIMSGLVDAGVDVGIGAVTPTKLPGAPSSMGPGPMMLGLPDYSHEVKNVDYFKKMLDSYGSNKLSNQSKKYFEGIINSVRKQDGMATKKQYDMLQRLRTGDFNYGKRGTVDSSPDDIDWLQEEIRFSTLPELNNPQASEVLDNFMTRINTPEGKRRLKELGITEKYVFDKLKIVGDENTLGHYWLNKIGLHPNLPEFKNVTRHEIEHAVQDAYNRSRLNEAFKFKWTDLLGKTKKSERLSEASKKITTDIDESLKGLELRRTPQEVDWNAIKTNDPKKDPSQLFNYVSDKQRATNYFASGSGGKEKSAFLGEVQQYMMDQGILPKTSYAEVTPEMVKNTFTDAIFDEQGGGKYLRLFQIMKPTEANYKLIADNLNKMLGVAPVIGLGTVGALQKEKNGGWLEQYQDGSQVPANFLWIDQDGQFRDVPIPVPPPKTFEEKVDDFLGNPQEKAMNLNRRINNDNLRHSAASMHTTESLGSTLGAAILAQGLGAAHEISSLPKRIQDTKTDDVGYYDNIYHNVIESGEDVFNNAMGSMVGMIPFIPTKAKESLLVYLSNNNMLPDGKSMPEGNEYVPKKKSGGWLDNY